MVLDVAPLAGAWIEIDTPEGGLMEGILSHPSRVRGLKYDNLQDATVYRKVAPLAGAWIEIIFNRELILAFPVAPLAGAWIEILSMFALILSINLSHPSRVRGLK